MNIKYANQDFIKEYESKKGELLNYYELCTFNKGIEALNKLQTKEIKIDSNYRVRRAVEYMLTHKVIDIERRDVEGFFDTFAISEVEPTLSDNEKAIIGEIFNKVFESESQNIENIGLLNDRYKEETLEVINEKEWQKNWKEETRINKIQEKGLVYFTLLKSYYGKTVLSVEEFEKAKEIYKQIISMDFYKKVFISKSPNTYEIIYKVPLYNEEDRTRVMIDALVVEIDNTLKGEIYFTFTPYVFKFGTTPAIRFGDLVDRTHYDMQSHMNEELLNDFVDKYISENGDKTKRIYTYINKTKFIYSRIDDFEEGVDRPLPVQFTISDAYIYELYKIRNLRLSNFDTIQYDSLVWHSSIDYERTVENFKRQNEVNSKANDIRIIEQNFEIELKPVIFYNDETSEDN